MTAVSIFTVIEDEMVAPKLSAFISEEQIQQQIAMSKYYIPNI